MLKLKANRLRIKALFVTWTIASVSPVFGQSYFLNGTAQEAGTDCYQLTTSQGNQNGAV